MNANDLPVLANTHGVHNRIGKQVALWEGDLTILEADAVVNAANDQMLGCFVPGHRCIDNVLGAAAGPDLRAECADYMARRQGRPEPTGSAVLTGGYHLPARHVIHTVGPIIPDRNPSDEDEVTLASCYRGILDLTRDSGLDSVGLCSVSTGVFGYPKDQAADVVLDTIDDWLRDNPEEALRIVISAFTEVVRCTPTPTHCIEEAPCDFKPPPRPSRRMRGLRRRDCLDARCRPHPLRGRCRTVRGGGV